jgi:hypothetical protein
MFGLLSPPQVLVAQAREQRCGGGGEFACDEASDNKLQEKRRRKSVWMQEWFWFHCFQLFIPPELLAKAFTIF